MRIGIDARELCGKPTGVGRHLAGLLEGWAHDSGASRHTFVLYAPQGLAAALPNAERRVVQGGGGTTWEQIDLPKAAKDDRLDVFFAPGYTAPLIWRTPTVVLVHDISFVAHPEWFSWKEGLRRRLVTRWSANHARLVLTVSEEARREILTHFGLMSNRVRCVYPGVASLCAGTADSNRNAASMRREPLVLFVGSIFNRRHIPDLIRAFRPISKRHPEARLEIVGDNRTHPHEDLRAVVAALDLQNHVNIRPYAYDSELAELYGRARAFALLSEYEGFGHPPLEALACEVPSVLLDTRVAREVCGEAALYVRLDDRAITSALDELLFDETVRARILSVAPSVLSRYSWARAAAETLSALEAAAGA
jgi:glycosyltransferase involved in cell wall biosynthesis